MTLLEGLAEGSVSAPSYDSLPYVAPGASPATKASVNDSCRGVIDRRADEARKATSLTLTSSLVKV